MATTETEIFDRLSRSLNAAADACEKLAAHPAAGVQYRRLRNHLGLIEGAARQAAHWREDARWLKVGMDAAHAHARAGDWLRSRAPRSCFTKLAASLRQLHGATERLRTMPTGRVGAILPAPLLPARRTSQSVGWTPTPSGLLIPEATAAA